jgi:hypothetical protein
MVNAELRQQVIFELRKSDGTLLSVVTFEGQGERVHAVDIFKRREHWSFGPFPFSASLLFAIRHFRNGHWWTSRMVGPLAVSNRLIMQEFHYRSYFLKKFPKIRKMPGPDHPMEFHVATVREKTCIGCRFLEIYF